MEDEVAKGKRIIGAAHMPIGWQTYRMADWLSKRKRVLKDLGMQKTIDSSLTCPVPCDYCALEGCTS